MEASELWWPQWRLRYSASNAQQLDQLSATGGMAVAFAPVISGANPLIVSGAQTRILSVWRTLSGCGFASRPKFEADLITIRSVESGQLRRTAEDLSFVADQGDVTLTRFATLREEVATADFTSTAVTIEQRALESAYRLVQQKECDVARLEHRIGEADVGARTLRRAIARIYRHVSEEFEQTDHTAVFIRDMFLLYIAAFWPLKSGWSDPATPQAATSQTFRAALRYIADNLSNPLTLSEISSAANVGPRALQMSFKRELGVTPLTYIIGLRLEAVRRDLQSREQDRLPIRHIAEQWGFTNMSDFARRFKIAFGATPRQFRGKRG